MYKVKRKRKKDEEVKLRINVAATITVLIDKKVTTVVARATAATVAVTSNSAAGHCWCTKLPPL